MVKKILLGFIAFLCVLVIVYALGPTPSFHKVALDKVKVEIDENIEQYVLQKEAMIADLKEGNQAQIVWADSSKSKTKYSLLYLHGFSASHEEGAPIHTDIGSKFGMNVYLSRLYDHGRADTNSFQGLTPDLLYQSAVEAMEIASRLGDSVIIFSVSTGSTLSVMLDQVYDNIKGHIMYSPNFAIADPSAVLVNNPWGKEILSAVIGGDYNRVNYPEHAKQYWNAIYHIDGIIAVQTLLEDNMIADHFNTITTPTLIGCYYKDEANQDNVVSVPAMLDYFSAIHTPEDKKRFIKYPNAKGHVFTSRVFTDDLTPVRKDIFQFMIEVLNISPVEQ